MTNEDRTVKTPNGHSVVLKGYLTGADAERIQEPILTAGGESLAGGAMKIDGKALLESRHKLLEVAVKSLDDSSENIVQRALELPRDDYEFILAEADKVASAKYPEQKRGSSEAS
jgi:hypothetical protein